MLKMLYSFWLSLARLAGRVNTFIILTLFYFLIITPYGLILRLSGWNPFNAESASSWKDRTGLSDLEREF
jgi:hypothetical protein